jgi:hypothetical protein
VGENLKGQIAFEGLFLLLIVISSAIFISTLYIQTHNSTVAITMARSELVSLGNSMDEVVLIQQISIENAGNNEYTIFVKTKPEILTKIDFGEEQITEIEEKIKGTISASKVTIQIN